MILFDLSLDCKQYPKDNMGKTDVVTVMEIIGTYGAIL
jgi:hypothetical protein